MQCEYENEFGVENMRRPNRYGRGGFRYRYDGQPVINMANRMNRSQFLRTAGVAAAGVGAAAYGLGSTARAIGGDEPWENEVIYLSDSGIGSQNGLGTYLYSVSLEPGIGVEPGKAHLTELAHLGADFFDQVDALACSPDGRFVYAVDKHSLHLGKYSVYGGGFEDLLQIGGLPSGSVVLAAFSPNLPEEENPYYPGGELFVASQGTHSVYIVDVDSDPPSVTKNLGMLWVNGVSVRLSGADLVFDAEGNMYVWTNVSKTGASRGLYFVTKANLENTYHDPATYPKLIAEYRGGSGFGSHFTGLAIRDNGTGDLIGSVYRDMIYEVDKGDGSTNKEYKFYKNGQEHEYGYGDMTAGRLARGVCNEKPVDLIAGQHDVVGEVIVSNDDEYLYVQYMVNKPGCCLTETHLHIGEDQYDFPTNPSKKDDKFNPAPGQFDYKEDHDCVTEYEYRIALADIEFVGGDCPVDIFVAAHAVVQCTEPTCKEESTVYGIRKNDGILFEIDAFTGNSWQLYDITPPPPTTAIGPNGLAYDPRYDRLYYCDYSNSVNGTSTLYFWNSSEGQQVAGSLLVDSDGYPIQNIAAADFYNGKYYFIAGDVTGLPGTATDNLYSVDLLPDGTAAGAPVLVASISGGAHAWTFHGDIAINKDGVVYGWGRCYKHGSPRYEFFKVNVDGTGFSLINPVPPVYPKSLQLAFGSDGTLIGHSYDDGYFYTVDLADGHTTLLSTPTNSYTDIASGEYCEPSSETAWGEGTPFNPVRGNWAMYFGYTVECCEEEYEFPPDGTATVAFEDLPICGNNDWDYNDWVANIHTTGTYLGSKLKKIEFVIDLRTRMAGYHHRMHLRLPANTFGCDGHWYLDVDGTATDGAFDHTQELDAIVVPDTDVVPKNYVGDPFEGYAILTIEFDSPYCEFDFSVYDPYSTFHGEGFFFDPYLHVNNTGDDIHQGDDRMLTVPIDWAYPAEGVAIWSPSAYGYPNGAVTEGMGPTTDQEEESNCKDKPRPIFFPNWWEKNPDCFPPPAGLISWWDADGSGDHQAKDIWGPYYNHGLMIGVDLVPGADGQAFKFYGKSVIEIDEDPSIEPEHLTVDAWVKLDRTDLTQLFVSKPAQGKRNSYALFITGGKLAGYMSFTDSTNSPVLKGPVLNSGEWFHAAITWDGRYMKLYYNGLTDPLWKWDSGGKTIEYTDDKLLLGAENEHGPLVGYEYFLYGCLDEVEIYNKALSLTEIQNIYNHGKCKLETGGSIL